MLTFLAPIALIVGCEGQSSEKNDVAELKKKLQKYQNEYEELGYQIRETQQKILSRDSTALDLQKKTLVSVMPLKPRAFQHYIEMQGNVSSKRNINVSNERGGIVEKIYVTEGDEVEKREVLIQLDDETIRSNIDELETRLELASKVYQRQKNLWEKNIGSEIQYLQAKNEKESIEKQLKTARTRLKKMKVKAPIDGTIDEVIIKKGEMASPGRPLLRLVELKTVQVQADASQQYVGKINKGDSVLVEFPSIGEKRQEVISSVGQVINPNNRTFKVEVTLDNPDKLLKPNLLATLKIADYKRDDAIVIPAKYIQYSDGQEYVFKIGTNENGKKIAEQVMIERGKTHQGNTEVLSGLKAGDQLITDGFRGVIDGEPVRIDEQVNPQDKLAQH